MQNNQIRLMLVDDHQMFIDGLKAILRFSQEIKVVGEALNGKDALELIPTIMPDVMITDISMPGMTGDELARAVSKDFPSVKILALSMHDDIVNIDKMVQAGITGYILKNTGRIELIEAIKKVSNNEKFYSKTVQEAMLNKYVIESQSQNITNNEYVSSGIFLSFREKQIIKLIVKGYSSSEIADELGLSIHTISSHRKNIYTKLKVTNMAQLIDYINKNKVKL